jgi:SAM-dependent methyltransferase
MRSALDSVAQYIDYEPNWLAAYEYGLNGQDSALKTAEFKFVERSLKDRQRWGKVRRYLDIGTCTARYPVGLYRAMAADGETIGIDADSDCKRFASKVVATKRLDRIHIRHQDFLAADLGITDQFDLVTCMLGTVSHFGYDGTEQHATELLPFALRRMHSLLTPDGLLLLGTWSDAAIDNRDLLGIYSTIDRDRLSSWSPHAAEFGAALVRAGLRIVDRQMVDSRLNVWVLEPTPLSAPVPAHPAQ